MVSGKPQDISILRWEGSVPSNAPKRQVNEDKDTKCKEIWRKKEIWKKRKFLLTLTRCSSGMLETKF